MRVRRCVVRKRFGNALLLRQLRKITVRLHDIFDRPGNRGMRDRKHSKGYRADLKRAHYPLRREIRFALLWMKRRLTSVLCLISVTMSASLVICSQPKKNFGTRTPASPTFDHNSG